MGCRGFTPGWGRSPHTPFVPTVSTVAIDRAALLNLGTIFLKGTRSAPFKKKFIHEISNTSRAI